MSQAVPLRMKSANGSFQPFRFRDLPAEIRNKIYMLLLCDVGPEVDENEKLVAVPTEINQLRHNIQPQILRVNRATHAEAQYVMRKTNLFIRVIVTTMVPQVESAFIPMRLPLIALSGEQADVFKDYVMTHKITAPKLVNEKPHVFLFLWRDLQRFVDALKNFPFIVDRHDEYIHHDVTVVDSYAGDCVREPFYTQKLQEALVNPYRALRGFANFSIKGVPKNLRQVALAEITTTPSEDPELIFQNLQEMKAKGNEVFHKGDLRLASDCWAGAQMEMVKMATGKKGAKILAVGGEEFSNRLAALHFTLSSNLAQNFLTSMRFGLVSGEDRQRLKLLGKGLFQTIDQARNYQGYYAGATWDPLPEQIAKLLYKGAVGFRLIGTQEDLTRADTLIKDALLAKPGDEDLGKEKERVSEAITKSTR